MRGLWGLKKEMLRGLIRRGGVMGLEEGGFMS